ncbi:MAG: MBL fold metallo-hydrolase [Hadesarchaea archaeon]|nr:MAG: MBL fold metallo-hydrolase [Hadesarchaea archaeon]
MEEVLPGLYRVEVPLPRNPLRAVNSYVVRGGERNLIVDTGMNREECASVLLSEIGKLGIDLRKTDFFITHLHADHLGLVSSLLSEGSRVYFNRLEAGLLTSWEGIGEVILLSGIPETELYRMLETHPGRLYGPTTLPPFTFLEEGSEIEVGDFLFRCLATPGHTRGHLCLYEPQRKLLLSGDHVLQDITPNLTPLSGQENPLEDYLRSLERTASLEVDLVLPGHREPFRDLRGRVEELRLHHHLRAEEVLSLLEGGRKTAYELASGMTWDLPGSWENFPPIQKWFATGEALAHLRYLEGKGKVRRVEEGERIEWELR